MGRMLEVIFPLIVIAIWVLNFLLNREVQAPARPARPLGAPQPSPAPFARNANTNRTGTIPVDLDEPGSGRRGRRADDDFLVVSTFDNPPQHPSRSGGPSSGSPPRRPRSKPNPAKKPDLLSARPLENTNVNLTQHLSANFQPLSSSMTRPAVTSQSGSSGPSVAKSLIESLRTSDRTREMILLREILGPPPGWALVRKARGR